MGLGRAWPSRGEQAGHSGLQTYRHTCAGLQGRDKDAPGSGVEGRPGPCCPGTSGSGGYC